MKKSFIAVLAAVFVLIGTAPAYAHISVSPSEVGVASRDIFSVSVPNESDNGSSVVGVRLVIPEGVESVRPNTKPGWTIDITKSGEGDASRVTEINWTGGSIPVDNRDDFLFGAKAPAQTGDLNWKAYETYSDGSVVAWDQPPSEAEGSKPYSITKVIDDLAADDVSTVSQSSEVSTGVKVAIALSAVALIVATIAVVTKRR